MYGGTPSGVMAAVAAARNGHSVALVDINNHLGGVVSGGLTSTDTGDRATVGGLADEFFKRVEKHYHDTYGENSKQFTACKAGQKFEPKVAEMLYDKMVAEQPKIQVWKKHRFQSAVLDQGNLAALVAEDLVDHTPRTFTGDVFIDASYEGDLMAGAHVPYRVGRESRSDYGELLAGVSMGPKEQRGLGDHRTMAYNYRVCITSNTENRMLCPKPEHYTPEPFAKAEGAAVKAGRIKSFIDLYAGRERSAGPNDKYDSNWCDFVGNSEGYAEGDWTTRAKLETAQHDYVLSRLYYLQNDPDLPEPFREDARKWGLPKDEFTDNNNFPFQFYVREARRMIGRYVLREKDLSQDRWKADGVATGSYGVDCHVVQMILEDGRLVNEHTRHVANNNYDIPYASLTPLEPDNLLVPVCCSTSHVACCSLRMEPVYMMLGQASGTAAHLAITGKTSVQKVDVKALRSLLREQGAVLDAGYQPQVKIFYTPQHPKPGEKVIFKVTEGALLEPITSVAWDFEGIGKVSADATRAVHTFEQDRIYTVSLLVTDKSGRKRLLTEEVPVGSAAARDVTMDDFEADLFGRWNGTLPDMIPGTPLRFSDVFMGPGIQCDEVRNGKTAPARARFTPNIPRTGRYLVCLGFRPSPRHATNVPLTVHSADGAKKLAVDERKETTPFNFTPVGEFHFKAGTSGFLEITNGNADGRVVIDGARWVWLGE